MKVYNAISPEKAEAIMLIASTTARSSSPAATEQLDRPEVEKLVVTTDLKKAKQEKFVVVDEEGEAGEVYRRCRFEEDEEGEVCRCWFEEDKVGEEVEVCHRRWFIAAALGDFQLVRYGICFPIGSDSGVKLLDSGYHNIECLGCLAVEKLIDDQLRFNNLLPLTIFYRGKMKVYNAISPEKAEAIMLIASTTARSSSPAATEQLDRPEVEKLVVTTDLKKAKQEKFVVVDEEGEAGEVYRRCRFEEDEEGEVCRCWFEEDKVGEEVEVCHRRWFIAAALGKISNALIEYKFSVTSLMLLVICLVFPLSSLLIDLYEAFPDVDFFFCIDPQETIKKQVAAIAMKKPVGILEVNVVQAMKLKKKDLLGKSDPYNEEFQLVIKDPETQVLELRVFDWEQLNRVCV
ncbi:hypothetical protein ZIOFF_020152 [Zingiber officinale]|uniref:Protein TIFY n=1 Tax=Zingiber officinale TaxID=94328 RepID=A0A8J5H7X8_ZINOF|nr:hypothetical protein ZIOFF_020152 [Zingiber officinale]